MSDRTLDLEAVCDLLRAGDIPAYVEQTGGGCATILVGEPDPAREGRYVACAGPGWFDGPGWTNGRGSTADFYVGPDDDGEGPFVSADHTWDEARVAAELGLVISAEVRRRLVAMEPETAQREAEAE